MQGDTSNSDDCARHSDDTESDSDCDFPRAKRKARAIQEDDPLPEFNLFLPRELPVDAVMKVPWHTPHRPKAEYAVLYEKYLGQGYFDTVRGNATFNEVRFMANLKALPVFSHQLAQHLDILYATKPNFLVVQEACEAVFCLVERNLHSVALMTDCFLEDIQTFAHLTYLIELYFVLLYREAKLKKCILDDRPQSAQPKPTEHGMQQAWNSVLKNHIKYTSEVKPHVDMAAIIAACSLQDAQSVSDTLLFLEMARNILLMCMLTRYDKMGPSVCKVLREKQQYLMMHYTHPQHRKQDYARVDDAATNFVEEYAGISDYRRSYRTLHLLHLPIERMPSLEYRRMLTRQLSVGVVPLFDFESSALMGMVDANFHQVQIPGARTHVVQAMCQMPDPVMEYKSFDKGLVLTRTHFSPHVKKLAGNDNSFSKTYFPVVPATKSLLQFQSQCVAACSETDPRCSDCAALFFAKRVGDKLTPDIVEQAFTVVTKNLAKFPPRVKRHIVEVGKKMESGIFVCLIVARMVRIYSEILYLGVPLKPKNYDSSINFPSRYQMFELA